MDTREYSAVILQELAKTLSAIPAAAGEKLARMVSLTERTFVAGVGRSGLAAKGFAMRLNHMGLPVAVCGETTVPPIGAGDVFIALSGSGNTPTVRCLLEKAKAMSAHTVLITANPNSDMGRLSEVVISVTAPTREESSGKSMQPMGTLFEQSSQLFLDAVVLFLMEKLGCTAVDMKQNHTNME